MAGNGGIIGPINIISKACGTGEGKITSITSDTPSAVTTQPGTRLVKALIVAGGGGGGDTDAGGGGAGGLIYETSKILNGTYKIIVGEGGLGSIVNSTSGYKGYNSMIVGNNINYKSIGGGGGAGGMLTGSSLTLQPGTYTVTVGAGGAAGTGTYEYVSFNGVPTQALVLRYI